MISVLWLALAWMAGWRWNRKLIGDPAVLLAKVADIQTFGPFRKSAWPVLLFQLSAALWIGVLPLTWATYAGAALLAPVLPLSIHPLLVTNIFLMTTIAVWLIWTPVCRMINEIRSNIFLPRQHSWPALVRSLQEKASRYYLLVSLVWLAFALWLMTYSFWRDGTSYHAGYSVFSDFAPHTALVSSFANGRNWPTEYPHFANDGIAYHFMFFFLCGNLNFLGLPLDWAINLPSILGMTTFCLLLGTLAMRLTGRRFTYFLAPFMLFFRSSMAFFTFLGDLVKQFGLSPSAWPDILAAMLRQSTYIGNTTNDSWGLWGINVYANQRHLLPGLSVALIILFLFLPDLQEALQRRPGWRGFLTGRDFWFLDTPESRKRLAAALLLCILLPYFHGSALIALLLVLGGIAVFSCNRLAFLLTAGCSVLSALIQSSIFAGEATRVVRPALKFGFIASDTTPWGVISYLLEMSGLLLPLVVLAFLLPGRRRKILLASFLLPLVFALTISLTPDVTVNHKYIMISFALCNIFIADFLGWLWARRRHSGVKPEAHGKTKVVTALAAKRTAAVLLAVILTITGFQEIVIYRNINKNSVAIDSRSPLVTWIIKNTRPDAVFVSAPYHYNAFYLSGRSTWLGHAYYAWSAGHDTAGRLEDEQEFLSACGEDLAAVQAIIGRAGLDYLIIDDILREHDEFSVDEDFFDRHFAVSAVFAELGNLKVYDLHQVI